MGYNPSYKWINPTYPIYNWGYNPLTKWDEPPSMAHVSHNGEVKCLLNDHPDPPSVVSFQAQEPHLVVPQ